MASWTHQGKQKLLLQAKKDEQAKQQQTADETQDQATFPDESKSDKDNDICDLGN